MYRIALRVTGVDLDDDATFDAISDQLDDLTWMEIDGRTLAILHTDGDPVGSAVQSARHIAASLAGARVADIDQDLVGVSDIGKRVGVTREAVRLWVDGKRGPGDFPQPVGSAGGGERGSMRLWQWPSVNDWLRHYNLHDDEETLSAAQTAEISAALHRVLGPFDRAWQQASRGHIHVPMMKGASLHALAHAEDRAEHRSLIVKAADYGPAMDWHERRLFRIGGDSYDRDDQPSER